MTFEASHEKRAASALLSFGSLSGGNYLLCVEDKQPYGVFHAAKNWGFLPTTMRVNQPRIGLSFLRAVSNCCSPDWHFDYKLMRQSEAHDLDTPELPTHKNYIINVYYSLKRLILEIIYYLAIDNIQYAKWLSFCLNFLQSIRTPCSSLHLKYPILCLIFVYLLLWGRDNI